ncbi:MAG: mechanosensitive ion channel [Planctomycetes bacterium]|nr:mechanosensitive ion channel [Planctomycetota bacterium]
MEVFGITLVGMSEENGQKLLLTLGLIALVIVLAAAMRGFANLVLGGHAQRRARFWTRQAVSLFIAVLTILVLISIWFDDPTRLATALGLVTAGLAFALQKVVTSIAGYFVILRGNNFSVGDRITMGGVRGDVIALGFIQTTIMEMGQPPSVQSADPAVWVKSRQFTGRVVTVANSRIFDEPIYNYTREFPYIWEEMTIPIAYRDDRAAVDEVLVEVARAHAVDSAALPPGALEHLFQRYGIVVGDFQPRVYWRLTDNWLEMTVRFLAPDHGIRDIKDAMSREVIRRLDAIGIGLASATFAVVEFPPVRLIDAEAASADRAAPPPRATATRTAAVDRGTEKA